MKPFSAQIPKYFTPFSSPFSQTWTTPSPKHQRFTLIRLVENNPGALVDRSFIPWLKRFYTFPVVSRISSINSACTGIPERSWLKRWWQVSSKHHFTNAIPQIEIFFFHRKPSPGINPRYQGSMAFFWSPSAFTPNFAPMYIEISHRSAWFHPVSITKS